MKVLSKNWVYVNQTPQQIKLSDTTKKVLALGISILTSAIIISSPSPFSAFLLMGAMVITLNTMFPPLEKTYISESNDNHIKIIPSSQFPQGSFERMPLSSARPNSTPVERETVPLRAEARVPVGRSEEKEPEQIRRSYSARVPVGPSS